MDEFYTSTSPIEEPKGTEALKQAFPECAEMLSVESAKEALVAAQKKRADKFDVELKALIKKYGVQLVCAGQFRGSQFQTRIEILVE